VTEYENFPPRFNLLGHACHDDCAVPCPWAEVEALKKKKLADNVNHPPHYTAHPSGVECIEITEHYNFNIGNAIKYLWRAGLKEGVDELEDLKKAVWYINREMEKRVRDRRQ
jgi:hypothetical protein